MRADPAWKSALLHKGQDVADLLEAVLSGKEVDLTSLPVPSRPDQETGEPSVAQTVTRSARQEVAGPPKPSVEGHSASDASATSCRCSGKGPASESPALPVSDRAILVCHQR